MIIFSPHSKFTMQRISDHVANGAYFYTSIDWQEIENWVDDPQEGSKKVIFNRVDNLLDKLTDRYDLKLTPRQRNYRLEKGYPICTCIVQRDVFNECKWTIHLLFTTPRTRDFNLQCGVAPQKITSAKERAKIEALQLKFQGFSWRKPEIQAEIDLIYRYFKDQEPLQFVLDKPVSLQVTQYVTFELARTDHKVYRRTEKEYKDRIRSFSWSWRYSKQSYSKMKTRLVTIVHKLISQKDNNLAAKNRADLKNFFKMIEAWAVFKSNRQQSGEIIYFALNFMRRKSQKSWQKIEIDPPHLVYLPRLENYAENLKNYRIRRSLFDQFGVEIPLELYLNKDFEGIHNYAWLERSKRNQKTDEQLLADSVN